MPAPSHLSVTIQPEQRRWIRSAAVRNGVSVADIIRALMDRLATDEELLAWCVNHARPTTP